VHYMPSGKSGEELKLFSKRIKDTEYYLEHDKGFFFIITNRDNSLNFKIMKTSEDNISPENWQEFIAHREEVRIDYIQVFNTFTAIYERSNGLKHIRIKTEKEDYYIDFPEAVYTFSSGRNRDYESTKIRFHYNSLTTPES